MQHILLATDGSESAQRAAEVAAHLAQALRGKLSIVTVERGITKDMEQFAGSEGSLADAVEGFATRVLCQARDIATKTGITAVEARTSWGDPAEVILEMAFRGNVDAIVVGRRGRGRLAGLLLGSVSQKLVSLAPCTVVVVP